MSEIDERHKIIKTLIESIESTKQSLLAPLIDDDINLEQQDFHMNMHKLGVCEYLQVLLADKYDSPEEEQMKVLKYCLAFKEAMDQGKLHGEDAQA